MQSSRANLFEIAFFLLLLLLGLEFTAYRELILLGRVGHPAQDLRQAWAPSHEGQPTVEEAGSGSLALEPDDRGARPATLPSSTGQIDAPPGTPTPSPTPTVLPSPTPIPPATATPNPPTATPTPVPPIPSPTPLFDHLPETCFPQKFAGVVHCSKGPYQILRVDPLPPFVQVRVAMPQGYDRWGNFGECRDVLLPDSISQQGGSGPGCHLGTTYPAERVDQMAARYPQAVAAINGDFFSPFYTFGAMGLTVKDGVRLDLGDGDRDERSVRRSSLSISRHGRVRIGIVDRQSIPDPLAPWTWKPDPEAFWTTVGGLPQLVRGGRVVELKPECIAEEGWCPETYIRRARTAVGVDNSGKLIMVVVPEEHGLTLLELAHLMLELGATDAINLDGGGSSQMWYAGEYLLYTPRPVAQGLIVLSEPLGAVEWTPIPGAQ